MYQEKATIRYRYILLQTLYTGEEAAAEDEDTGAQIASIVKLEEVAVTTGEENEDPIFDMYNTFYLLT